MCTQEHTHRFFFFLNKVNSEYRKIAKTKISFVCVHIPVGFFLRQGLLLLCVPYNSNLQQFILLP